MPECCSGDVAPSIDKVPATLTKTVPPLPPARALLEIDEPLVSDREPALIRTLPPGPEPELSALTMLTLSIVIAPAVTITLPPLPRLTGSPTLTSEPPPMLTGAK